MADWLPGTHCHVAGSSAGHVCRRVNVNVEGESGMEGPLAIRKEGSTWINVQNRSLYASLRRNYASKTANVKM